MGLLNGSRKNKFTFLREPLAPTFSRCARLI